MAYLLYATWLQFDIVSSMYQVARETNEELRLIKADPAEGFDVGAILSIARRCNFFNLEKVLGLKCQLRFELIGVNIVILPIEWLKEVLGVAICVI